MTKNLLLCITGGIAAYKTPSLVRLLVKKGFKVKVVLSSHARYFVGETSLSTVSGNPIHWRLFPGENSTDHDIAHIELAQWADQVLVAPATANIIAKMANGIADDLISTTLLALSTPLFVAPAMNTRMYLHPATQKNIQTLKQRGTFIIGPDQGELACKTSGPGRMTEPEQIVEQLVNFKRKSKELAGKKVLITTGATREYIDPVRFISNPASGKTGIHLARAAREMGAQVMLIAGHTSVPLPDDIPHLQVSSTREMLKAVLDEFSSSDLIIMAAAIGDWTCKQQLKTKLKKSTQPFDFNLKLTKNPDILKKLGELNKKEEKSKYLIGFAAETVDDPEELIKAGKKKLDVKKCNLIIANTVNKENKGFQTDTNQIILISHQEHFLVPETSKAQLARKILEFASAELRKYRKTK
ncbi:MAG: bifunctional phosphopantothenoylcysteine decarboxylase/phosphopantothenate--cysteine ligase CoaBC [Deltaproteobacteria bacterium]|jgi:phosphopantothenoylcysteine decarboxylase/phosphopantothenate--cysteine ligase|nr:bifunctional phosphopantothenoylcysteine decarboxylase/phosphopantothenate--cysteine ligase CoaBC [Deltaproteobacteria bacterium]